MFSSKTVSNMLGLAGTAAARSLRVGSSAQASVSARAFAVHTAGVTLPQRVALSGKGSRGIQSSASSGLEMHGTTILCVRKDGKVVMMGDGQVSQGDMVVKPNATKVRKLANGSVLAGYAGSTADALTLMERLEGKLEEHDGQLQNACVSLAKDWRTDKYLRRLEAVVIVADNKTSLKVTGLGDVLAPNGGVIAVGSGQPYALAAARALSGQSNLSAEDIARQAMEIAAELCVYTNSNFTVETLDAEEEGEEKGEA